MLKSLLEKYKKDKKTGILIFIGVLGVLLMLAVSGASYEKEPVCDTNEKTDIAKYKAECEKELSEIIEAINGVDSAKVMITFSDNGKTEYLSEEKISLQEGENSLNQDKENTAALIRENGDEAPVVIRKLLPEVKGAAVVVDGNNSMELEKKISASVKSALGISVNKISIVINERNE